VNFYTSCCAFILIAILIAMLFLKICPFMSLAVRVAWITMSCHAHKCGLLLLRAYKCLTRDSSFLVTRHAGISVANAPIERKSMVAPFCVAIICTSTPARHTEENGCRLYIEQRPFGVSDWLEPWSCLDDVCVVQIECTSASL
jgi:hypothetical protein